MASQRSTWATIVVVAQDVPPRPPRSGPPGAARLQRAGCRDFAAARDRWCVDRAEGRGRPDWQQSRRRQADRRESILARATSRSRPARLAAQGQSPAHTSRAPARPSRTRGSSGMSGIVGARRRAGRRWPARHGPAGRASASYDTVRQPPGRGTSRRTAASGGVDGRADAGAARRADGPAVAGTRGRRDAGDPPPDGAWSRAASPRRGRGDQDDHEQRTQSGPPGPRTRAGSKDRPSCIAVAWPSARRVGQSSPEVRLADRLVLAMSIVAGPVRTTSPVWST